MSFSESIDLNVTAHSSQAADDLRDVGRAAGDAKEAVDELDAADVDIAIDDAQLPSVKEALEEIRDQADKLDQQEISVDVDTTGMDRLEGSTRRAATGIDNVRDRGDKSRSVLANMVGNSAQDLGALGGIAGSTGVAIGQLAEYSAEGDIKLKNLVTTGGAMIGVGLLLSAVMGDVAKEAKAAAEIDAFDAQRVEAYTEALRLGKSELEAINEVLRETEALKVPFTEDITSNALGDKLSAELLPGRLTRLTDAVPALVELGVNFERFTELVGGNSEQINAWAANLEAAGADADTVRLAVTAIESEQQRLKDATKKAADETAFWGEKIEDGTAKANTHKAAVQGVATAYDEATAAARRFTTGGEVLGPVRGPVTYNFHPPAPTPQQVQQASQEYTRVYEGPR